MNQEIKTVIDHYLSEKRKGLDFTEIRKELVSKNYDHKTISDIIQAIDDQILKEELNKTSKIRGKEIRIIGMILFIGGLIVTITTYLGIINVKDYFILAYGPIIAGLVMIIKSRRMDKEGRLNKKRSYFGLKI